jgi:hypothetical protein
MISDIAKLTKAIVQATPERQLVYQVQSGEQRIKSDIDRQGFAEVTVEGRKFRVKLRNGSSTAK